MSQMRDYRHGRGTEQSKCQVAPCGRRQELAAEKDQSWKLTGQGNHCFPIKTSLSSSYSYFIGPISFGETWLTWPST